MERDARIAKQRDDIAELRRMLLDLRSMTEIKGALR
jgi:hypothetical protein